MRTDGDGLDLDALLNMSGGGVVGLLVAEDGLAAEGVDEGGASCRSNQRLGRARRWCKGERATHQCPKHRRPSGRTESPS